MCVSCSVVSDSLQPHGLYNPPASSVLGILQARKLCGQPFPFLRDLLNLRIEPSSPALQADSLLSEPPEKPMYLCVCVCVCVCVYVH